MLSPCALLVNLADTAGSPGGQPLTETKGPQDWSHIDPCFLSSRGFGRRSGKVAVSNLNLVPPTHSPGSPVEEV